MRVQSSPPSLPSTSPRGRVTRGGATDNGQLPAPLVVSLSDAAEEALEAARESELDGLRAKLPMAQRRAERAEAAAEDARAAQRGELNEHEQEELEQLQRADRDVRAHEAAHVAAAAGHAGTPRYKTVTGPDGRQYAIGGSVSIDMSPGATPEATAQKLRAVRAAATAVSDPSPADNRIATAAAAQIRKAEQEQSMSEDERVARSRGSAAYQTVAQAGA